MQRSMSFRHQGSLPVWLKLLITTSLALFAVLIVVTVWPTPTNVNDTVTTIHNGNVVTVSLKQNEKGIKYGGYIFAFFSSNPNGGCTYNMFIGKIGSKRIDSNDPCSFVGFQKVLDLLIESLREQGADIDRLIKSQDWRNFLEYLSEMAKIGQ